MTQYIRVSSKPTNKPNLKFSEISIDGNEEIINIPDNSCNDTHVFIDINKMKVLKELIIGNNSFQGVEDFNIDNLNELTKISIDYHSFATSCNPNPHGSFNVSNCEKLESIQLGDFTFTHHSDSFTIRNLPSLRHLDIGKIGIYSLNFYWASFCVRGICFWCVTIWNRSTETWIDCIGKWGIRIVFTHSIREYDIDVSKWMFRFDLFGKDRAWRESIDGTGWRYL